MHKALKMILSQAINSNKLSNYSEKPCPDQVVGIIEKDSTNFIFLNYCSTKSNKYQPVFQRLEVSKCKELNENVIVIVLESPHIDEYDPDTKKPIGPAYGKTGDLINKHLIGILNSEPRIRTLKNGSYDLILVNAIQHQCSLGENTRFYRDAMFFYYWEKEKYRTDFKERLNNIFSKYSGDKILINSCTKGAHSDLITNHKGKITKKYIEELGVSSVEYKDSLSGYVNQEIKCIDNISIIKLYNTPHPSSWYVKKNIKINQ